MEESDPRSDTKSDRQEVTEISPIRAQSEVVSC